MALSLDGECLLSRECHEGPSHGVVLGPYVDEAVSFADSHAIPLDAVAVSSGPGLCYGRHLKLVSVPTLQLLCVPLLLYRADVPDNALLCPMLDARRMEVYSAIYDRGLKAYKPVSADIIDEQSYGEYLDRGPVLFFGNGAEKCKPLLGHHPNAIFVDGIEPLAKNMMPLAERNYLRGKTEDVAYFEPFYLKEFVATQPKKLF